MIFHNRAVASVMVGDCLASLRSLPNQSAHMCVTSPPYYGLRDYGHDGQIGLEETPDAYVARLVEVFREVRRVLRDDGTLWLNIGDSYANDTRGQGGESAKQASNRGTTHDMNEPQRYCGIPNGLKKKDLIGIPWMLAFALRADGWYLRQDIIWHKPNPMPESVRDRCTKAHEYVFLLSKSERYFYDHGAIKEAASTYGERKATRTPLGNMDARGVTRTSCAQKMGGGADGMKNKRSVWTVAPKPYSGAHFAVYPPELIEPCILSGCPDGGVVLDPFGGSGTTAGVALAHGRNAVLCELNPEYAALMPDRVQHIIDRIDPLKVAA